MSLPNAIGYQAKSPVLNIGYLFLSYWSIGSHRPQTLQTIAIVPYTLELDGKSLLLKTPHTWVIVLEESKLVQMQILHLYWLAFIALEGAVYTTRAQK